jgi:2-aminophenol/2-amino-5-chlorophenol 1,6-dioxygenase beta subunit
MSKEHVFSHTNYLWDMRVLQLMREGKMDELLKVLPEFIDATSAEVKSGGLFWMLAAMDFAAIPAKVHGYWSVIATGNAVVEWDLTGTAGNGHQEMRAHA